MAYFKNVRITNSEATSTADVIDKSLRVTAQSYLQMISEGYITGHSIFQKIGYSPAATTSQTSLWNPGTEYVFPDANISVEAVSTSANDTAAGSGAKTCHLAYLDSNYIEKTYTFIMNGTTPVAGPTDFFRVNTFHVETGAKTAGVVSLRLVGGAATVYGQMPIGETRSRNSIYTVPLGKTVFIHDIIFSCAYSTAGKSERMTLHTSVSPDGTVSTTGILFYPQFEAMIVDGTAYKNDGAPIKCPEKTDIKVSIIGETNAISVSSVNGWIEIN